MLKETVSTTRLERSTTFHTRCSPHVSVILPVRNEKGNLRKIDSEVRRTLETLGAPAEVIYVDDQSVDGSAEILEELVAGYATSSVRARLVTLRRNFGQTAALAAGIDLASGEVIVSLDADGQNDPADIPRLLERLEQGYDVVSGWRRSREDQFLSRRVPSLLGNWLVGRISGLEIHDCGCTLKACRSSLLKEVRLYGDMHRFLPVYLAKIGARITEIEVNHRPRLAGESKYGSGRIIRVLSDLVHIHFVSGFYARPMHFFGPLAALFLMATLLVMLAMFAIKFGWLRVFDVDYQASFISTPLPSLAATFFLGAVTSLFFGLLAEILIRIQHEAAGYSPYAIRRVKDSHVERR